MTMPHMTYQVDSVGRGATGEHHTQTAKFYSVEQRMGGSPDNPNPLELFLGALTGCMNVVLQMVASERGLTGVNATYHAEGQLDTRGFMGDPAVDPHFQQVEMAIAVSGVSKEDLEYLREQVDRRCPVHSLIDKAGIPIQEVWTMAPKTTKSGRGE